MGYNYFVGFLGEDVVLFFGCVIFSFLDYEIIVLDECIGSIYF